MMRNQRPYRLGVVIALALCLGLAACNLDVPQVTPTVAPTLTPTDTPPPTEIALVNTPTDTPLPSETPTLTPSETQLPPTETDTAVPTDTFTPSNTPTNTPTDFPTATPSDTPTDTFTPSDTFTPTDTPTFTPTDTPLPTITDSPTPTFTPTPSWTPSDTPTNTPTDTLTPSDTNTPPPTVTDTFTPTDTRTPTDTDTPPPTRTPTDTLTPSPTASQTATDTDTPTITDTPLPSPTFTPTDTDTPPPSKTPTATLTPTATSTFSPTPSQTPSDTLTPTASHTNTPTSTDEPTATDTLTPSATNTQRPTATDTPLPSPTPLPTSSWTPTLPPSATDTDEPTATLTETPSITPTLSETPPPTLTQLPPPPSLTPFTPVRPTWTAVPSGTPTRTVDPNSNALAVTPATNEPTRTLAAEELARFTPTVTVQVIGLAPTLDVPPTFATRDPINDSGILPVATSDILPTPTGTGEFGNPSPTPFVLPTIAQLPTPVIVPTAIVITVPDGSDLEVSPFEGDPGTLAFALSTRGGITRGAFSLPGGGALFTRNPIDPNRYATVDTLGLLYFVNLSAGTRDRFTFSPFNEFVPNTPEENDARIRQVAWSPDGNYLAFLVDTDRSSNDGVWYIEPARASSTDPSYHLFRDCPPGCNLEFIPDAPYQFTSREFEWSPDSARLLIEVFLPEEGRNAMTVVDRRADSAQAGSRPNICRYDYASWTPDGRVLVSGHDPNNNVVIGFIDRDCNPTIVFDVTAALGPTFWLQDAVQRDDSQIFAFGSPSGQSSAMALYDGTGNQLTGFIGDGPPQRVLWSPDHMAALLLVNGRTYLVRTDTELIEDITNEVAASPSLEWVQGELPVGAGRPRNLEQPAPVGVRDDIVGREAVVRAESLNIRSEPNTGAGIVGGVFAGEAITIIGGPVIDGGYTWYEVQRGGVTGWIVGETDGVAFIQ